MYSYLLNLLPTKIQQAILCIGAFVGAFMGWLFDGISNAFYWFLIFMLVDYITGMMQAFKNHNWSSKTGFKGIIKKAVILTVVILFHGLSQSIELPILETAVIFAFALNELCSILENIERMGMGDLIPKPIYKILDVVSKKTDDYIDKLK